MATIWERYGTALAATMLIGIPLALLAVVLVVRWRLNRGQPRALAVRNSVLEATMVLGTAPWVWMIMTPTAGEGGVNLVPFRDLAAVFAGSDVLVQLVGNLLVFAVLGFCLPMRFRLARPALVVPVVVLIAAAFSAILEILQFVLGLGRVSSIDDVIVNAAGAGFAAVLSAPWWITRHRDVTPSP